MLSLLTLFQSLLSSGFWFFYDRLPARFCHPLQKMPPHVSYTQSEVPPSAVLPSPNADVSIPLYRPKWKRRLRPIRPIQSPATTKQVMRQGTHEPPFLWLHPLALYQQFWKYSHHSCRHKMLFLYAYNVTSSKVHRLWWPSLMSKNTSEVSPSPPDKETLLPLMLMDMVLWALSLISSQNLYSSRSSFNSSKSKPKVYWGSYFSISSFFKCLTEINMSCSSLFIHSFFIACKLPAWALFVETHRNVYARDLIKTHGIEYIVWRIVSLAQPL